MNIIEIQQYLAEKAQKNGWTCMDYPHYLRLAMDEVKLLELRGERTYPMTYYILHLTGAGVKPADEFEVYGAGDDRANMRIYQIRAKILECLKLRGFEDVEGYTTEAAIDTLLYDLK